MRTALCVLCMSLLTVQSCVTFDPVAFTLATIFDTVVWLGADMPAQAPLCGEDGLATGEYGVVEGVIAKQYQFQCPNGHIVDAWGKRIRAEN